MKMTIFDNKLFYCSDCFKTMYYDAKLNCDLYDVCDVRSEARCQICEHESREEKKTVIKLLKEAGIMK